MQFCFDLQAPRLSCVADCSLFILVNPLMTVSSAKVFPSSSINKPLKRPYCRKFCLFLKHSPSVNPIPVTFKLLFSLLQPTLTLSSWRAMQLFLLHGTDIKTIQWKHTSAFHLLHLYSHCLLSVSVCTWLNVCVQLCVSVCFRILDWWCFSKAEDVAYSIPVPSPT